MDRINVITGLDSEQEGSAENSYSHNISLGGNESTLTDPLSTDKSIDSTAYNSDNFSQGSVLTTKFIREKWDQEIRIMAKIIHVDRKENFTILDCILDEANLVFEKRQFEANLLDRYNFRENDYCIVLYQTKKGASKISLIRGSKHIAEYFDLSDILDELDEYDFNKSMF